MTTRTTTTKPAKKVIFCLRLQTTEDESLIHRLKAMLKLAGRRFGFRALSVECEQEHSRDRSC
jgi:hypothetical protein